MSFQVSPNVKIAGDSSRIQHVITSSLDSNSLNPFARTNFFDSLKQKSPEVMQRRLDTRRHPMTGISGQRSRATSYRDSAITREFLKQQHKLNPRILETWLNNTVADAEEFEVPGTVLKQENKLPLARFGIDRSALLTSGLPSIEIDRLYQSLFVHSIGFYQLILKVLEHTEKKYSIVTGIWKVFAILLEYCCQLDYEMIITTLNIEKRDELEQLENEYKGTISQMEEHEKRLLENINNVRNQLKDVQKDLQKEIEKREELEDELLQRGSGHEEEVAMRLLFESKLNQMYAKQRDMTTKIEQLTELGNEQQKLIDLRNEMVNKEKKRANDMIQGKIEIEQEMKKMEERQKQLEVVNANLESRLDDSMLKIEGLSNDLSNANMTISDSLNEIAQKRIAIDDQKFEIDVGKVQIVKLESLLKEYAVEKLIFTDRIVHLEKVYAEECKNNQHFEQEHARIKESEMVASQEYKRYKSKCESLEKNNEKLEQERDGFRVSLESSQEQVLELTGQVKRSQEKIEEMNRGRRVVEEENDNLKARLMEKTEDLQEARKQITVQKQDIDTLRNHESELEGDVSSLQIKLRSLEKQYETTKETLMEKVNNLNDILNSEKKIRENWIYRYEEEQKSHSNTTKALIDTEDRLNESVMKTNSLTTLVEEKSGLVDKYMLKNKDQLEEILSLRTMDDEYARKNKTLNILIGSIEKSAKEKIHEIYDEIEDMKIDQLRDLERKSLLYEELWETARFNLEIYERKCEELESVNGQLGGKCKELEKACKTIEEKNEYATGKCLLIEELEMYILKQSGDILSTLEEFEKLRIKHFDLHREHQDFLNKVPLSLRKEKNPFVVLEDKIKELQDKIKELNLKKENFQDAETQFCYEVDSKNILIQTDIDMLGFEKLQRKTTEKALEKVDQFVQSSIGDIGKNIIESNSDLNKEFPLRKKLMSGDSNRVESIKASRQHSIDSVQREEETVTPVNLRSIYKHQEEEEEAKGNNSKLPSIAKRQAQPRPPTMPLPMTSEIKRHIKQANSRRKNDILFS